MYDFAYHRPGSLADAARLAKSEDAKLMAGGMTLIPTLKQRLAKPSDVIDLSGLKDLVGIKVEAGKITIGALTPHAQVAGSKDVQKALPALAALAEAIGDPQVRNRGTIGGSLAHGDPASDLPAVMLAVEAELVIAGPEGERTVPAAEFFRGVFETAVGPGELLTEIRIPKLGGAGWSYLKFTRRAQDWATVGVAAIVRHNGGVQEARIGLTNMGDTPLRATAVEQALVAGEPDPASHIAEGTNPCSDVSASPEFRSHLARVVGKRAIEEALSR